MTELRHGCRWTTKEDNILKDMFKRHARYGDMAMRLGRTWYACKCRCIRLGLLDNDFTVFGDGFYKVPNPYTPEEIKQLKIQLNGEAVESSPMTVTIESDKPKYTFSNEELDVVLNYLKSKVAWVSIKLLEASINQMADYKRYKDWLADEIHRVYNLKLMSEDEREKVLTKVIVA